MFLPEQYCHDKFDDTKGVTIRSSNSKRKAIQWSQEQGKKDKQCSNVIKYPYIVVIFAGSFKWYIAVIVVVIVLILSIIGICIFWKRRRKSFYSMRKNCDNVRKTSSDAKRNTTEYDEIDYNNMQSDNAQKSGGATDHGRQLVQQQFTGSEGIAGTEYTEMNIIGAADMQEYTHMYQPLTDNRQSDSHKYSSVNQKAQPSDIGIVNLQCVEASNETSNTNELTYEKQAENIQANNRHTLNLWRELYANLPDNSRNSLTEASKKDVKKGKKGLKKIN